MAFISTGYNPAKPMEGRITDIGPHKYDEGFPSFIKENFGKWLYHEILEPGVLVHVAESGAKVYTSAKSATSPTSTAAVMCAGPPATTSSSWWTTKAPWPS